MNAFEKLAALQAAEGPETKKVTITVGEVSQDFTIRRMSFQEVQEISLILLNMDDDGTAKVSKELIPDRCAAIIAAGVLNDDGTQAFTVEQASKIKPAIVAAQLFREVSDFNNLSGKPVEAAAKNSSATASVAAS